MNDRKVKDGSWHGACPFRKLCTVNLLSIMKLPQSTGLKDLNKQK